MRFIRKNGRIIPIGVKKEAQVAKDLVTGKQNKISLAKIAGASLAGFGILYGAGRLSRYSDSLQSLGKIKQSNIYNRIAKITKFAGHSSTGIIAGKELASIDSRTNDERASVLNLGNATQNSVATVASLAGAYGAYRIGKRFEYAGKLGKNLAKLKDIKSMIKLRAI